MMKAIITVFIFTFITFFLSGCNKPNNNLNNENNISSSESESKDNKKNTSISRTSTNSTNILDDFKKIQKESEISSFSTPLTSGAVGRITNIKITSEKINGHILKKGDTFSFNEIIGPCTAEEGYQEAEIYVNKKIKYALGGRKLPS